jgi:hypothetical protein
MTSRLFPHPSVSDELPLFLRAFVETAKQDPRKLRRSNAQQIQGASDWSVVFDTETTIDPGQSLRIGFCRVYYRDELRHHVLFYPDTLTKRDMDVVRQYAKSTRVALMTRDEFVDKIFYKYGYHLRAMIIGFNLPFDLSRLAISHAPARGPMRGGFSLKLSPLNFLPPIQVKHLSKYVSIMRFAAPYVSPNSRSQLKHGKKTPHKRGYFLEVKALAAALFSRSFTLGSLADFLGVPHSKLDTDRHGKPLTREYLEYAERDVLTTWECYRELCLRYDALELEKTPIHRIFSEASIGKAYFTEMGIEPWFSVQKDIPRRLLAQIMSAYFGGRSEVRIRRELRQVMLCDFLSMYPTVCTLLRLWPYVTAKGMRWRDGTREASRILQSWTLKDLQDKANWRKLVMLVRVKADGDIFPVRAQYADGADGTIGANYLFCKKGLWSTLADCLSSQLLTGKPVEVLQAVAFQPGPVQPGLKPVAIGGNQEYLVDPARDDFYKLMIELRQVVKGRRDKYDEKDENYIRLDVEQNALKIAASATSYGIFAEINVNDRAKEAGSRVHPATSPSYVIDHIKDEQPGRYFHPLLAATITGAARLMLAITERLIQDEGLEWAFCDTDSMAIAKPRNMPEAEFYERVERIVAWFSELNPYNFTGSILKIEGVNYSLEDAKVRQPLFVWAISAKRYALLNIENGQPVIRKASAHGLGQLRAPYDKSNPATGIPAPRTELKKIGVEHWHHDLWWLIAKAAIDGHPDEVKFEHHPSLKMPAASQYAATTPKYLRWFDKYNDGLSYERKLKPFGFVSAFSAKTLIEPTQVKAKRTTSKAVSQIKPVAPFDKRPNIAARNAFDRITGDLIPIEQLKTYQQALAQYHLHPEDKFLNADFLDRGTTIRRHVRATGIENIGKESNKWEDQYYFGFDPDDEINYGSRPDDAGSLLKDIRAIVDAQGLRTTAGQLRVSRSKLSKLLENELADCTTVFLQRLFRIVTVINAKLNQEKARKLELLRLANKEIRRIGFPQFARCVGCEPSNLRKGLRGTRELGAMGDKIGIYFGFDSTHK